MAAVQRLTQNCTPKSDRLLVYGFLVALGGLPDHSAFCILHSAFACGWLCLAFCPGAPLWLSGGALNGKLGHSWPDSLCVRNNLPRGEPCHPQPSIRYPLWLPRPIFVSGVASYPDPPVRDWKPSGDSRGNPAFLIWISIGGDCRCRAAANAALSRKLSIPAPFA